jgi:ribosome-binding protein aMBF1 (putative translation factor)
MKPNINQFPTIQEIRHEVFKKRPGAKKVYDSLKPKYNLIEKTIKVRKKQGLSQTEVAKRMGTKQSSLARFEAGKTNPTLKFIQKLAKALETTFSLTIS